MSAALLLAVAACVQAVDPSAFLRSGRAAARSGDWSRAEIQLARAEQGARLLDDPSLELAARIARVDLRLSADETDSAAALLPPLPRRAVAPADTAVWRLARARTALARGDRDAALTESNFAVAAARRADEAPLLSAAWLVRGRALLERGDVDGAATAWKKGRSAADDVASLEASAATLEARIALARGRTRDAQRAGERALARWRAAQDVGGILSTLPVRARIDQEAGAVDAALESWSSAARIAESTGLPRVAVRAHLQAAGLGGPESDSHRARARAVLDAAGLPASTLPADLAGQLGP